MITYLQSIKDTKTQRLTQEVWESLITSPQTQLYITEFRKSGNLDMKQRLPAVNFHGYDPKVLKGLQGSRKQADLIPTGLFMLDVDHIDKPQAVFEIFLKRMKAEGLELKEYVALAHITPSGKGLRIVMRGRKDSNIKDDQAWLASMLCVQHDECTKDLSRWSFIPMKKDILFINPQILFATPPDLPTGGGDNPNEKEQNPYTDYYSKRVETTKGTIPAKGNILPPPVGESEGVLDFPENYRGIPYKKIVEALIQYHGGTPEQGERHQTIITLANDLRSITDSNVDWLAQLIPSFGKPSFEKQDAITWCVQHKALYKTKALAAVLDWLQNGKPFSPEQAREEEINSLDEEAEESRKSEALKSIPQMPEKLPRLVELLTSKVMDFQRPAVAQMVFPALAAHVADSVFINNENKKFELSLMGVVVGKQSVGKGCIDAPIERIIDSILTDDELAREELRAWAASQQNKKANEKGTNRPEKPIRIFNTDTTPAALLANLYNAQHNGYAQNLCCFTKSEEIEEMYDMSPTSGRSKVAQLIKKTYDRGRIGSERFTSSAANYTTVLRWNWISACTPEKAKAFFKKVLTDGTLSRVDFAAIIPTEEDINFVYGDYDEAFEKALEPYIQNLRDFRCEHDKNNKAKPFRIAELSRIEQEMDEYIRDYSKTMPDDTWRNFAWRTKLNCLKKIIVLFIANGGRWEESFETFCWWTFYYSMWVKMNLFYEKASEAFADESIVANVSIKSPLEILPVEFTRDEFYKAMKKTGQASNPANALSRFKSRGKIVSLSKDKFKITHSLTHSKFYN